jgi:uncharacterized membrane protein
MNDLVILFNLVFGVILALALAKIWKCCSDIRAEVQDLRKELLPDAKPFAAPEPETVPEPAATPPPLPDAPPPLPPVKRERPETAFTRLCRRSWNWIVVGEEYRREGVPMEVAIATNWLVRIGVLVVIAGLGFFLDYTAERGWLGPLGQLALALLAGTAALYGGASLLGKKYHLLAQGLLGLGVATWYGSVFAAEARFQLIGETMMFLGLCVVTVAAVTLSVRIRSLLIGVLSVLGGYVAPLLISGQGPVTGLVIYLLMLAILVVAISRSMDWPLLSWTGLLGHLVLSLTLLFSTQVPEGHLLLLLTGGFLIYSVVPILMWRRQSRNATLLELGYLFLNAGGFFLLAYWVLRAHSDGIRALLPAGLCVYYVGTTVWKQTRPHDSDRTLEVSLLGLAVFFGMLTPPQLLQGLSLTVVWSILAGVLMGMAIWMPSGFLRKVSLGIHTLVAVRLVCWDTLSVYVWSSPAAGPFDSFLKRILFFGVPVLSLMTTLKLLARGEDDAVHLKARRWTGILLFLSCLSFYQFEAGESLALLSPSLAGSGHLLGWMVAAGVLMRLYAGNRSLLPGAGMMVSFVAGGWLFLFGASPAWRTGMAGQAPVLALYRWLDFLLLTAFMIAAAREFSRDARLRGLRNFFGYGALLFCFGFTSREVVWMLNTYLRGSAEGGLSVYWAAFALALVSAGLIRRLRSLRLAGLMLFAVTAGKVILVDLAGLDPFYRILAFLLLGGLLLAGAFVYLRFQEQVLSGNESGDSGA